jgi:hypothetical protein
MDKIKNEKQIYQQVQIFSHAKYNSLTIAIFKGKVWGRGISTMMMIKANSLKIRHNSNIWTQSNKTKNNEEVNSRSNLVNQCRIC